MKKKKNVSSALVLRVSNEMENEIRPDDNIVKRVAEAKNVSSQVATQMIVRSSVNRALRLAGGDELRAKKALMIVNGHQPRLYQAVTLLGRHRHETVALAYEAKAETISAVSFSRLCQMFEHTDGDLDGEAGLLVGFLDEIALRVDAKEQEWAFHAYILESLREERMLEAIIDEGMEALQNRRFPSAILEATFTKEDE